MPGYVEVESHTQSLQVNRVVHRAIYAAAWRSTQVPDVQTFFTCWQFRSGIVSAQVRIGRLLAGASPVTIHDACLTVPETQDVSEDIFLQPVEEVLQQPGMTCQLDTVPQGERMFSI